MARIAIVALALLALAAIASANTGNCVSSINCPANQEGFAPYMRKGITPGCRACADNKYKTVPDGASVGPGCCQRCVGVMVDGTCTACPENAEGEDGACVCEEGFQAAAPVPEGVTTGVLTTRGCVACPEGTVNPTETVAADACTACGDNSAPNTDRTVCECIAGSYKDETTDEFGVTTTACTLCPVGTASSVVNAVGAASCLACENNSVAAGEGSTACTPCEEGYAANLDRTACDPIV